MWSLGFQVKKLGHFRYNNFRLVGCKNALTFSKLITWCGLTTKLGHFWYHVISSKKLRHFYSRRVEKYYIENALTFWFEILDITWNISPSNVYLQYKIKQLEFFPPKILNYSIIIQYSISGDVRQKTTNPMTFFQNLIGWRIWKRIA